MSVARPDGVAIISKSSSSTRVSNLSVNGNWCNSSCTIKAFLDLRIQIAWDIQLTHDDSIPRILIHRIMDSVAILFRDDGAVFIGSHLGDILAISDDDFNLHYAVRADKKVKSIDLRNDGLLSVERELLGRLQQTSKKVENPVELSVNIRFEKWDYSIEASFIHEVLLWTLWSVRRSRAL